MVFTAFRWDYTNHGHTWARYSFEPWPAQVIPEGERQQPCEMRFLKRGFTVQVDMFDGTTIVRLTDQARYSLAQAVEQGVVAEWVNGHARRYGVPERLLQAGGSVSG